jgi:hypothetical protein
MAKGNLETILILVCMAVAVGVGFSWTLKSESQNAEPTFTPFTAQIEVKHYGSAAADAAAEITHTTTARKADGSQATFTTVHSPDGKKIGEVGDIFDVSTGREMSLESFTRSKSTIFLSPVEVNGKLHAQDGCSASISPSVHHAVMLRQKVYNIVSTNPSPSVTEADNLWVAPELGCFVLKGIYRLSTGPWNQRTVISLKVGSPSESMFQSPAGYVERSPKQLAAAWQKTFPGYPFMGEGHLKTAETKYRAHRRPH